MVDAHAHLDKYGEDLLPALDQIRALSVRTLAVSMDVASYDETARIADSEPLILPSFGIHPWEAPRFAPNPDALAAPLERASAIGEIGLDHHYVEDEGQYPEALKLGPEEEDAYFEVFHALTPEDRHQLLGHPDPVQGDMTEQCQLV